MDPQSIYLYAKVYTLLFVSLNTHLIVQKSKIEKKNKENDINRCTSINFKFN